MVGHGTLKVDNIRPVRAGKEEQKLFQMYIPHQDICEFAILAQNEGAQTLVQEQLDAGSSPSWSILEKWTCTVHALYFVLYLTCHSTVH